MSNTSFALLSAAVPGSTGRPRLGRRFGREFRRYYVSARLRRARARTGTSSAGGVAGPVELRRSRRPRQPWHKRIASMFHVRWVLAGLLLLVPGFLTDVAGALLLVPALQRRILATLLRSFGEARSKTAAVVKLDPDEWRRVAEEETGQDPKRVTLAHSCPPAPPVLDTPPESGSSASRVKEEQ